MTPIEHPIQINKLWFTPEYFLKNEPYGYFSINPTLNKVYYFLKDWYSNSKYIEVNTSGTTGSPQKLQLKKTTIATSAIKTCSIFKLTGQSLALLCLPIDYIAGKLMIVRAIVSGLNLIIEEANSLPMQTFDGEIDFVAVTPMQLKHMINHQEILDKAKIILAGGAPIDNTTLELLSELKPRIYQSYGMTETATHVAIRPINHTEVIQPYTAIPGVKFSTDNNHCLIIHAPYVSNEPIVTKDVVKLIDEYHFYWQSRLDFVINTGGIKVYPEDIEKKITTVLNTPFYIGSEADDVLGEKVVLYIEDGPDINLMEIEKQLEQTLDTYEKPRNIIKLKKIRFSPNGKIIRKR